MDKESFFLSERIKGDKFNEETEKSFQQRYNVNNRIDEYFETPNNSLINEENKKKLFLNKLISPIIDLSKNFYSSLQLIYEPKLYHFSFLLTALWAYKNLKCANKLLQHKYNDIYYQIIRPDSLNSRSKAFKILVLGGLVIPVSFSTFLLYDINKNKNLFFINNRNEKLIKDQRIHFIPYTLHRRLSNTVFNFKENIFCFAKNFAENNNLKKLSMEYHKNMDSKWKWLNLKR